ncbi:MAG: hypothetical protein ACI9VM_000002 [Candidatus Azotimanducaceae bacterium]|jgi:hypothetical protein
MLEQSTFEEKKYLIASDAAKLIGYSSDYVTRLAREEKIVAKQINRKWFIEIDSLKLFSLVGEAEKRVRKEKLREERISERAIMLREANEQVLGVHVQPSQVSALMQTAVLSLCLFVLGNLLWVSLESDLETSGILAGVSEIGSSFSDRIFQTASFAFILSQNDAPTPNTDLRVLNDTPSSDPQFQGIVVFENEDMSAQAIDAVRESFSDEVRIDFEGDDTGVITPVFKDREGDDYRFLLVPVNAEEN